MIKAELHKENKNTKTIAIIEEEWKKR